MTTIYNTARICPSDDRECDITNPNITWALDPQIETRLKSSTDYDEQLYLWVNDFLILDLIAELLNPVVKINPGSN